MRLHQLDKNILNEGWFSNLFGKETSTAKVKTPVIPEDFPQKLKTWKTTMSNAYTKIQELIDLNQWTQLKSITTKIKNGVKKGIDNGYITFPTPEKQASFLKNLNSALSMKVFDQIKIDRQEFSGGGLGTLIGAALAGPIGAAVGAGLGSARKGSKMSAQELAISNALQQTHFRRQDNKGAVIARIEKFQPSFLRMLNLPSILEKTDSSKDTEPVKQQPKPQAQSQAKPKSEPVKQQPKPQAQSQAKPKPQPQAQSQAKSKPQQPAQAKPKSEPVKQQPKQTSSGRFAFNPLGR